MKKRPAVTAHTRTSGSKPGVLESRADAPAYHRNGQLGLASTVTAGPAHNTPGATDKPAADETAPILVSVLDEDAMAIPRS
jgi:hypothetical protein